MAVDPGPDPDPSDPVHFSGSGSKKFRPVRFLEDLGMIWIWTWDFVIQTRPQTRKQIHLIFFFDFSYGISIGVLVLVLDFSFLTSLHRASLPHSSALLTPPPLASTSRSPHLISSNPHSLQSRASRQPPLFSRRPFSLVRYDFARTSHVTLISALPLHRSAIFWHFCPFFSASI